MCTRKPLTPAGKPKNVYECSRTVCEARNGNITITNDTEQIMTTTFEFAPAQINAVKAV